MSDYEFELLKCPLCGYTVYQRDDRPRVSCVATPVCRKHQPGLVAAATVDVMARCQGVFLDPNNHGRK